MTNSIDRPSQDRILDTVLELLTESHIAKIIDDPVQRAVATFDNCSPEMDPYWQFIDIASRFYDHLYKSVETFDEEKPGPLVQREWINLLETRYQTARGSGFYLAYLDACEDIEPVLSHMAAIVVSHLRERHARWIYFRWVAGLAWDDRCMLVKTLFDRCPYFSEPILRCPPPLLADRLLELISAVVSTHEGVRNLLIGDTGMLGERNVLPLSAAYAYSRPYRGYGCRSEAVLPYCDDSCRLRKSRKPRLTQTR